MPSIVDVAKRAGVSVTTVSRVINDNPHRVNPETRKRILQVAEELNFKPSSLARALVSDQSCIIGVVVGDITDPYFSTIVRGISDVALEHGYLPMTCNSDRVPDLELHYVQMLRNYHVDGIIFAGGGLTDTSYLEEMQGLLMSRRKRAIPIVTLGRHLFNAPQVNIDNTGATREITDYLIGLGHQRIGFIAGPSVLTTSALRLEGYKQSLEVHGIPYNPELVIESDFTYESGFQIGECLLQLKPSPTAVLGSNDMTAIGCLTFLNTRGIKVPGEISVAGFDDIAATQYTNPPLSTIHVPMRDLGITGMKQLLRLIESEESVETMYILPHSLVIRASCAAPSDVVPSL